MFARPACSWLSAFLAIVAAVLWYVSSKVRVLSPSKEGIKGPDMILEGRYSLVGTAAAQARWSSRAAVAAAAAAIFQGIAVLL